MRPPHPPAKDNVLCIKSVWYKHRFKTAQLADQCASACRQAAQHPSLPCMLLHTQPSQLYLRCTLMALLRCWQCCHAPWHPANVKEALMNTSRTTCALISSRTTSHLCSSACRGLPCLCNRHKPTSKLCRVHREGEGGGPGRRDDKVCAGEQEPEGQQGEACRDGQLHRQQGRQQHRRHAQHRHPRQRREGGKRRPARCAQGDCLVARSLIQGYIIPSQTGCNRARAPQPAQFALEASGMVWWRHVCALAGQRAIAHAAACAGVTARQRDASAKAVCCSVPWM